MSGAPVRRHGRLGATSARTIVVCAVALAVAGAPGLIAPASADARAGKKAKPAVHLAVSVSKSRLTVRVTAQAKATCTLKVSAKKKSTTFPKVRASAAGKVTFRWAVPSNAPSGTWRFTVKCTKSGKSHKAKTKALIVNHGNGKGALIEPSTTSISAESGNGKGGSLSLCPQPYCQTISGNPFESFGSLGQCTWYAIQRRVDLMSYHTPSPRDPYQAFRGNAKFWFDDAVAAGVPTGQTPVAGALVVWDYGDAGHVAYVEAVLPDGRVTISEYNHIPLTYDTRTGDPRTFGPGFRGYVYGGPAGNPGASGGGPTAGAPAPSFNYQAFAADFDGDGIVDIGMRNASDGTFFIKHGPGFNDQTSYAWAAGSNYQPFAADFDGDGKADIGMRDASNGTFFIKHGPDFNDQISYAWAAGSNYQPFAADFDGDGKADIGMRDASNGIFFILRQRLVSSTTFTDQTSYPWAAG
jgi:surface antigen